MGRKLEIEEINNLPSSKAEALELGSDYFFTGIECKNGHSAPRRVSDGRCFICSSNNSKRKRAKYPKQQELFNAKRRTREYKDKENARIREKRKIDPKLRASQRNSKLKKSYGIDGSKYDALLIAQGGVCAICKKKDKSDRGEHLSVDHDHLNGRVRGLLCSSCNKLLGNSKDNTETLRQALKYLEQNNDYRNDKVVQSLLDKGQYNFEH